MTMRFHVPVVLAALLLVLAGCVTVPSGPSMLVLPGSRKSFDEFQADNAVCRQFADMQVGGATATQTAQQNAIQSAAVGTLLGAAIGAAAGHGRGAAIGAASGLALGSAVGASTGNESAYELQRRYDNAYVQCMYARGNQVPVAGNLPTERAAPYPPPPPSSSRYYGTPPPPPPGVAPPPRDYPPPDY